MLVSSYIACLVFFSDLLGPLEDHPVRHLAATLAALGLILLFIRVNEKSASDAKGGGDLARNSDSSEGGDAGGG